MTSIEPKVDPIEELDFDVKCSIKWVKGTSRKITRICDKPAFYWAKIHNLTQHEARYVTCCTECLIGFDRPCKECGEPNRLLDYGPL